MPDLISQALSIPGLGYLLGAALAAGLVRGFSGFGTALIFLPVAAQVVNPVWAVTVLVVMDVLGPAPAIPRALKEGHRKDLLRLILGTAFAIPLGLSVLVAVDPIWFKLLVSIVGFIMLAILIMGLRYQGHVTPRIVWASGAAAGFLGSSIGIPGPPVILLYMASSHPVRVIRANITAFLFFYDILMLLGFLVLGRLYGVPLFLGCLATIPNLIGNLAGAAIFNPKYESLYRWVAYAIIAASSLSGLYGALA
jgi:uncharacterized membrane protein YfcA